MQTNQEQVKGNVYNNYFIIVMNNSNEIPSNLKEIIKNKSSTPIFQPFQDNYFIKTFLSKKRKISENSIIIKEEDTKKSDSELSDDKKNINVEKNKQIKNSNCIIEIPDENLSKKKVFGRKPNSLLEKPVIGTHTKFSEDNILRKIKIKFFTNLVKYLNSIIIKYKDEYNINPLFKIEPKVNHNNTINFNIFLLNSKLKDIFSNFEISVKFTKFEKDYNKKVINSIYDSKITELIDILEMTFLEVFKIFRENNNGDEKLKGLSRFDEIIQEIKGKENNDDYIIKFIDVAKNYENYYFNKTPRKK